MSEKRWTMYRCPEHGLLPRSATHLAFGAPIGSDELACSFCGGEERQLVEQITVVPADQSPALSQEQREKAAELSRWFAAQSDVPDDFWDVSSTELFGIAASGLSPEPATFDQLDAAIRDLAAGGEGR